MKFMELKEEAVALILKELIIYIKTLMKKTKLFKMHYGDLTDSTNLNKTYKRNRA